MSETYEGILSRMSGKFEELAGYEADRASDIGIRLRVLAGEIYSMTSEIEWLRKQMFPDTATGAQLDLHGTQRGLSRRRGRKADGLLVFRLDMPLEFDLVIPIGTVCTVEDGSLNYVTTEEAEIYSGDTFAWVACEAENSGEKYNIAADRVKTIVTYFSVGIRINNASSFIGGTDDEDDDSFRKRIFESYRSVPNGADAEYFRQTAESVEGVQSASVYASTDTAGLVFVVIGGRGAIPSDDVKNAAAALLAEKAPLGITVSTQKTGTIPVNVSVNISVRSGYDINEVKSDVESVIRKFFLDMSVGEDFRAAALGSAVIKVDGVTNYSFSGTSDTSVSAASMAVLGTLTVGSL